MDIDRAQTAAILSSFGYGVDKGFKFKIRDEKTPSASIDPKNGKIKDFGSGWYGDIVDFLVLYHSFSKKDAFLKVNEFLGQNPKFTPINLHSPHSKNLSPITQDIVDKFKLQRKENFQDYWQKLSLTIKHPSNEIKKQIALEYEIGYSKSSKRLIMPLRDIDGNCVSFWKYDPSPKPFFDKENKQRLYPKVMFSKGRGRVPFNLAKLTIYQTQSEPVFICEGEKDCLNALAFGFNAVTFGSASAHLTSKNLELFSGLNVIIAYDFDRAGQGGAKMLKQELSQICNVKTLNWKKVASKFNIDKSLKEGFDFSDFLALMINSS